jgi:putative transcriptional regulator
MIKRKGTKHTSRRTRLGRKVERALREVLAAQRGGRPLRIVAAVDEHPDVVGIRRRIGLSRQKFADRFGLDVRALQEWEQGRRQPDRAARVLLAVIDRNPQAVIRALQ